MATSHPAFNQHREQGVHCSFLQRTRDPTSAPCILGDTDSPTLHAQRVDHLSKSSTLNRYARLMIRHVPLRSLPIWHCCCVVNAATTFLFQTLTACVVSAYRFQQRIDHVRGFRLTLLGKSDHVVSHFAELLRPWYGRSDAFVVDEGGHHVPKGYENCTQAGGRSRMHLLTKLYTVIEPYESTATSSTWMDQR